MSASALRKVTVTDVHALPTSTRIPESTKFKILGIYKLQTRHSKTSILDRQFLVPIILDGTNILCIETYTIDGFLAIGMRYIPIDIFKTLGTLTNKSISHATLVSEFKSTLIALKRHDTRWITYKKTNLITFDPDILARFVTFFDKDSLLSILEAQLKQANATYHSGETESRLSDEEFDHLKELILKLNPKSSTAKQVGTPVTLQDKVTLPVPMGSLEKLKHQEKGAFSLATWLKKTKATRFVESIKIDGLSVQLVYKAGKLIEAYTRGDGIKGKPILPHVKFIPDVPQKLKSPLDIIVRAEIVIKRKIFDKKYSKLVNKQGFENGRNMVAGVTNRKSPDPDILKDVNCLAFAILNQPNVDKSVQLETLKDQGFNVVPYKVVDSPKEATLAASITDLKKSYDFDLDGKVLEVDNSKLRERLGSETNSLNPAFARAFKIESDDSATTTVTEVTASISKDGYLKPTAVLEPIRVGGVTITSATLYNYAYVRDNNIGPGTIVKVIRSGDVIPKIVEVIKSTKAQLPDASSVGDYTWNDTNIDLILSNKSDEETQLKRLEYFFTTLETERVGLGQLRKLYDAGYKTVLDIVTAKVPDLVRITGFEKSSATTLLANIKKSLNPVKLPRLMAASGCFGRGLAESKLTVIYEEFGEGLLDLKGTKRDIAANISLLRGFSFDTGVQFANGLPVFKHFFADLKPYLTLEKKAEGKLTNKSFCFTGFRDKNLKTALERAGAKVQDTVTKDLTYLVVKSLGSSSDKTKKAAAQGTEIITLEQAERLV